MGKLNIYIRDNNSTYYYKNKEEKREFIEEVNIKNIIEKEKNNYINFILSKPDVIFRNFSFEFSDIKKIKMVLPSELEESLSEKIDNFLFNYRFFKQGKKTLVNVTGVKKEFYNNLISLIKNKQKVSFFTDVEILFYSLKNFIKDENYIEIYIDKFYILINVVENRVISSSISYIFENTSSEKIISVVGNTLKEKAEKIYITGEEKEIENFANKTGLKINKVGILKQYQEFYFTEIINYKSIPTLNFSSSEIKIITLTPFLIPFLIFILLLIIPLTLFNNLKQKQNELNQIEEKMINEFRKTFPDVKKVVDPVIQTKEKLNETGKTSFSFQYSSILQLLIEVTKIFPENVRIEIDQLSYLKNVLTISGFIDNLNNLEKVKKEINKSSYFESYEIGTISFDKNNRINFSLTLKVKK
ncbi:MAG TPA: hypothetical protein PLW95_00375 [bacterium]|nr:hypothetical protein [bacterium]